MAHFPKKRDDGLSEYTVLPRSKRRATTVPLGQAAATESTALPPEGDEPVTLDVPAGRKGHGKNDDVHAELLHDEHLGTVVRFDQ